MGETKIPSLDEITPSTKGALVIPCSADQFGRFMSNLLGKPQTISKAISGAFDIKLEDIRNLHHLISQRINQQNKNSLIQFTCRIVFDDDSSVLLNSFEDLVAYNEIRALTSTQAHLHWSYLVYFEDRKAPEKQEVEISFITTRQGPAIPLFGDDERVLVARKILGAGIITFNIKHTARTWGADIEALLAGHLKSLLVTRSKPREFLWRNSERIGLAVGVLFFAASVGVSFWTASKLLKSQQELIANYLGKAKPLTDKVDFVLNCISSGVWPRYFFGVIVFLIVAFVLSFIFGIWADSAADANRPSFVLLTKEAEKQREKVLKKYDRKLTSFIVSIMTSFITGVASNWTFTILWKFC